MNAECPICNLYHSASHQLCFGRAQDTVHQYKLLVSELEAVLPVTPLQRWADVGGTATGGAAADPIRVLPAALQNLHDYFIHVAARLEHLHEAVDRAKEVFLAALRKVDALSSTTHTHPFHELSESRHLTSLTAKRWASIHITERESRESLSRRLGSVHPCGGCAKTWHEAQVPADHSCYEIDYPLMYVPRSDNVSLRRLGCGAAAVWLAERRSVVVPQIVDMTLTCI